MMDNGVLQAILQKRGGITGQEFESLVVAEIYKQAKNIRANVSFYHLRTQDGREVDLLVETQEGYFAFEIKMADHVSIADARHLVALEPLLDKPLLQGFILSNDPVNHHFYPKIQALHLWNSRANNDKGIPLCSIQCKHRNLYPSTLQNPIGSLLKNALGKKQKIR